jgi:hypothetical protein
MTSFDHTRFAPVIAELLAAPRLAPLDAGVPDRAALERLGVLRLDEVFAPHPLRDRQAAGACLAGLLLYFDCLDESHALSQGLETAEGSYWHALMHRREPDFWNSKYWFKCVGTHPVYAALRDAAAKVAEGQTGQAAFLTTQASWNPAAFVDLCEASFDEASPEYELCRQVQRAEWELLFAYCYERAVGT